MASKKPNVYPIVKEVMTWVSNFHWNENDAQTDVNMAFTIRGTKDHPYHFDQNSEVIEDVIDTYCAVFADQWTIESYEYRVRVEYGDEIVMVTANIHLAS